MQVDVSNIRQKLRLKEITYFLALLDKSTYTRWGVVLDF